MNVTSPSVTFLPSTQLQVRKPQHQWNMHRFQYSHPLLGGYVGKDKTGDTAALTKNRKISHKRLVRKLQGNRPVEAATRRQERNTKIYFSGTKHYNVDWTYMTQEWVLCLALVNTKRAGFLTTSSTASFKIMPHSIKLSCVWYTL